MYGLENKLLKKIIGSQQPAVKAARGTGIAGRSVFLRLFYKAFTAR